PPSASAAPGSRVIWILDFGLRILDWGGKTLDATPCHPSCLSDPKSKIALRLFVAIDVPETHAAALAGLRSDDLEARWTPAGQFHLTLRFLGDVEDERAGDVAAALGAIPGEPFRLHAQGLDVFPSRRNPRVLVVRVEDEPRLMRLQRGVDAAVRRLGVAADPKSFHPHVTLGRFKRVRSQ